MLAFGEVPDMMVCKSPSFARYASTFEVALESSTAAPAPPPPPPPPPRGDPPGAPGLSAAGPAAPAAEDFAMKWVGGPVARNPNWASSQGPWAL
eukprot:2672148-Pyramimonas_sp.AAC.1